MPSRARFPRACLWVLIVSPLVLSVAALPALSQEGAQEAVHEAAQEAGPEAAANSTTGVIFRWLNFALVAGGIGWAASKGGSFFRANAKSIAASIIEASAAKAEAERELRAVEAKISGLGQEVAAMKEAARRESEAEAQRLAASGRAEAEKIKQAALAEQAAAERAARQELRALAASLAVERAAVLLGDRMNTDTRAKIFDQFVGELSRSVN